MSLKTDILVIGGGVAGMACAWRLARAGKSVVLLERGVCGCGGSMSSLGGLMPFNAGVDTPIANAQRQSLWNYASFARDLFQETGIDIKYRRLGRLQPFYSADQRQKNEKSVEHACNVWPHWGELPPQEILTQEQALNLEPEVAFTEHGALHCRATGVVCPHHLVSALRAACQRRGVQIFEHAPVHRVEFENGRATRVLSAMGPFSFDKLVVAAGAWTAQILPEAPVQPLRGHAMMLRSDGWILNRLIRAKSLYISQIDARTILVGASKDKQAGFDDNLDEEIINNLLEKAEIVVPRLAEFQIEKKWVGFRPDSGIKTPLMCQYDTAENVSVVSGFGGIGLCATPFVADHAERLVLEGVNILP